MAKECDADADLRKPGRRDAPGRRAAGLAGIRRRGDRSRGAANLCWSIEGGRSRTGKLRPPRYGLLRYVADAVADSPDADPLLIPVSLMYDQLPGTR